MNNEYENGKKAIKNLVKIKIIIKKEHVLINIYM